jgi:nucleoside-diphosphate-sugar epimerase
MSDNRVYVTGGSGYIGSHLIPALIADGWDPINLDAGIYGHMAAPDKVDILDEDFQIPDDGQPVIWLATLHREPPGFEDLDEHGKQKWIDLAHELMVKKPLEWLKAGHPVIYPSSQMAFTSPDTLYGQTKRMFEAMAVGNFVQIFRFGTVWGGLQRDPARPQTVPNAALLGKFPQPEYMAYVTSIQRAINALVLALYRPFNGTVENVFDSDEPITGQIIRDTFNILPKQRTAWQIEYVRSADLSNGRKRSLRRRKHPTELLAAYYNLPWPEKTDVRKEKTAVVDGDGTATVVGGTESGASDSPGPAGDGDDGGATGSGEEEQHSPGAKRGSREEAAQLGLTGSGGPSKAYDPKFRVVEKEGGL